MGDEHDEKQAHEAEAETNLTDEELDAVAGGADTLRVEGDGDTDESHSNWSDLVSFGQADHKPGSGSGG